MNIIELFLLGLGLSMDAFAVSVCIGLSLIKISMKKLVTVGLYFGTFQAAMPFIGYMAAIQFAGYIATYDQWLVFAILFFLGGKMIVEGIKEKQCQNKDNADSLCVDKKCSIGRQEISLSLAYMTPLAIATSIDAMAAGISIAFLQTNIFNAIILIGIVTFVMSMIGIKVGHVFGTKFKSKASIIGGIILLLIAFRGCIQL
ncbi:MAG: manganese efflux pump MntP family protein [Defluviitaleaceae bacterium]|nr:manganese efflux pump MntP family protein [Defluviitaleaceae bacterium]